MACAVNGTIYSHEIGNDADTVPMTSGFQTGFFYIDEGRQQVFIDKIIPDFKYPTYSNQLTSATLSVSVYGVDYPEDTQLHMDRLHLHADKKILIV